MQNVVCFSIKVTVVTEPLVLAFHDQKGILKAKSKQPARSHSCFKAPPESASTDSFFGSGLKFDKLSLHSRIDQVPPAPRLIVAKRVSMPAPAVIVKITISIPWRNSTLNVEMSQSSVRQGASLFTMGISDCNNNNFTGSFRSTIHWPYV